MEPGYTGTTVQHGCSLVNVDGALKIINGRRRTSLLAMWPASLMHKLPDRIVSDILSAMHYSNGERSFSDLIHEIARGEKQIWVHSTDDEFNATVVTQVSQFPSKKTCEILYLGGDKAVEFVTDISAIEDWAREQGCDDIQAIGRRGWVKALAPLGYSERYTITGKAL